MSTFVISEPAEQHAIKVLKEMGLNAVANNTQIKTDPDILIEDLNLYADEQTKYMYNGKIAFDAIASASSMISVKDNEFVGDTVNKICKFFLKNSPMTLEEFVSNSKNPLFKVSKMGKVLDYRFSYVVHHLTSKHSNPGTRAKNWTFSEGDKALVIDYNVMRNFFSTDNNWKKYFNFNRKATTGAGLGDKWLSAYFSMDLSEIPQEAIVFEYSYDKTSS
jgi:hypothetical protein